MGHSKNLESQYGWSIERSVAGSVGINPSLGAVSLTAGSSQNVVSLLCNKAIELCSLVVNDLSLSSKSSSAHHHCI